MTLQKSALYVTAENFAIFDLKRAYHSHFSKVNRPQSPHFRRIRKKTLQTSVFLIKSAERQGLLCAPLELHRRSSAFADRRSPARLSLVVEPFLQSSNPDYLHQLQKKHRKGAFFVIGGVVKLNGIEHTELIQKLFYRILLFCF